MIVGSIVKISDKRNCVAVDPTNNYLLDLLKRLVGDEPFSADELSGIRNGDCNFCGYDPHKPDCPYVEARRLLGLPIELSVEEKK